MYILLVVTFAHILACHCLIQKDEQNKTIRDFARTWLESTTVSIEINKDGFHRELVTTVKFGPDVPNGLKVLLIYKFPRGLYVDPYQIASITDQSQLQILLNSAIDLEAPAHKTGGFVAHVYPKKSSAILQATIPIHCRYHGPSFGSDKAAYVNIGAPDLLLQTNMYTHISHLPYTIVDAPCTASNLSICSWVKIQPLQEQSPVSVQIPLGDGSLVKPVIGGTLLVTVICSVALSLNIWKHGIL